MHRIKANIKHAMEKNPQELMDYQQELLHDFLCDIKVKNPLWYKSIQIKMHELAHGNYITEQLAKEFVSTFTNEDGTTGEHWDVETTESVNSDKFDRCLWYIILNQVYSTFYSTKFTTEDYVRLAKQWAKKTSVNELLKMIYN